MDINILAVKLILLFLPGIISWFILEKLIISKKREFSYYIVYSFLLGFLSYFSYFVLLNLVNLMFKTSYKVNFFSLLLNSTEFTNPSIIFEEILSVSILGIFVSIFILAPIINYKLFHLILQKIRITKRFSEPDLWSYLFNSENFCWIDYRDLKNKRIYRGKFKSYSDTLGNIAELLLEDVRIYDINSNLLYEVPAIYLARECRNNNRIYRRL